MLKLARNIQGKKGQTIILAYVILIFLSVLVAAFVTKTVNERRLAQRHRLNQEVLYLAEGGIESALYEIRDIKTVDPHGDPTGTYPIFYSAPFDSANVSSIISQLSVSGNTYQYEIETTAIHNNMQVVVHQIIECTSDSAFKHSVFYNRDLELLPGASMTFSGKVHSNEDIYLGSDGSTLTMNTDYLCAAGNIYNRRKDTEEVPSGTVEIRKKGTSQYPAMAGLDCNDANWATESQTRWAGTVKSAVHGVSQLAVPEVKSIQPGGYYANKAGLKITNNTLELGGTTLVQGVDVPAGTVSDSTSFYNNREGKVVKMTEINMRKLAGWENDEDYLDADESGPNYPNHFPSNGLMYATRSDAGETYQPGIRLVNGKEIERTGGLTVVTNDPLYIQGDYNNPDDFADREPCAVICDAVNVLSNDWQDSDSYAGVDSRTATETTINTGFIAGIDDTETGAYNGGLENYPRMHERWSGINLNIHGAFLALWNSQIAQGAWQYGSPQYKAPIRSWAYDESFESDDFQPPEPAQAVTIEKIAWWKE